MTDEPAAIEASFSDFRIIKTRKQAQLIFEVPLEQADAALATLGGLPQPHAEQRVAVARLETKERVAPLKPDNTKLSLEAVMRCRDKTFWAFLKERSFTEKPINSDEDAAHAVRWYCGVNSRSGLNTDPEAAKAWRALDAQFLAWGRGAV